jgi:alanine-glyoxylate transaminase/serine-glyoxylate transaminase/serine-pyruvate transaminase
MSETGWFATLWREMAERLGLQPEFVKTDWRRGADVAAIEARLREDKATPSRPSASCTTRRARAAPRASTRCGARWTPAGTPALLLVDTDLLARPASTTATTRWGVDGTVAGSRKGLMLPPGLLLQRSSRRRR